MDIIYSKFISNLFLIYSKFISNLFQKHSQALKQELILKY